MNPLSQQENNAQTGKRVNVSLVKGLLCEYLIQVKYVFSMLVN